MRTRTKAALTVLCALLLVVATFLGTLAFMTSQKEITNTFTVGNVTIKLDETVVDVYGVAKNTPAERAELGNELKLIPGHNYIKDPKITVDAGSEDCWLFVKVENGLAGVEKEDTIATQLAANGWTLVDEETNVYKRATTNKANDVVNVFEELNIADDADFANSLTVTDGAVSEVIKVTAYAVQKDNFNTAQAAWDATFATQA